MYNVISSSRGAKHVFFKNMSLLWSFFVHGNKLRYKYTAPLELSQQIEDSEIASYRIKISTE
jgi:hypothetical protein